MGRGCQILWPHNSPSKSCCPAPRVGRRILMSSGPCHGWSSLGNWAGLISLVILSLNFVRIKFPLDFAFYIRYPGRTVLSHLQTPEFCRNSKFSPLQESRMPPRSWMSQLRQRKQRPKIFLPFNRARKKTLIL